MKYQIMVETSTDGIDEKAFVDLVEGFLAELGIEGRVLAATDVRSLEGSLLQALFETLGKKEPYRVELMASGIPEKSVYMVNRAFSDYFERLLSLARGQQEEVPS